MSRIGKKPIQIPDKVKVSVQGRAVNVDGPMGKLSYTLPEHINAEVKDGIVNLAISGGDPRQSNMLHGTARARIFNLVQGVVSGFSKTLEISGLGYRAALQGAKLNMELGFSHPVLFDIPPGVKIDVDPKQTILTLKGADKVLVGETAARIKRLKPPEPYKGSGIKYQGEHIARKAGKTAAGASGGGAKK